jgi:hypothetical protein
MRTIKVRNVHDALPEGVRLLKEEGLRRQTRNGPVLMAPWPVATVYEKPWERVLFWAERDANPFLHLYESLWMLNGQHDVAPLIRYTKQFNNYSDNGVTLHDAYGYRWRTHFGFDQLPIIIKRLKNDADDRRCVLQMWNPNADLGREGKAFPCNLTVTFSRAATGALDMVVFNRSNDMVWGAYGANAVHFSVLQEYMAREMQVPVGTYTQISTNFHAYLNTYEKIRFLPPNNGVYGQVRNPYHVRVIPTPIVGVDVLGTMERLMEVENSPLDYDPDEEFAMPWARIALRLFQAFHIWRFRPAPEKYDKAFEVLSQEPEQKSDWICAAREWLIRRADKWAINQAKDHTTLGEA